ncbi:MAG: glycosyltransferase family 1 protein, partial [Anaerolineae bacterium]|nr:glycosyltransferase family 1 protein [Anaerolineae bacterium]
LARARGHQVTLYFNEAPAEGTFAEATRRVIPFPRLWTHLRLGWALRRDPPDVFFTPAHVIPISYFGPSVATVHDLGYRVFPAAHTAFQLAYLNWSTLHNARRSRRVLADSKTTRDDLVRFYHISPAKIDVVYPGVDPSLAPVRDPDVLAAVQARYTIRGPYMLYLGTIQPRKNLVRLVEAYAASGITESLVLAGKAGWLSKPILDAMAELPLDVQARIRITGFVDEADKAALFAGATALLYPSLYEGFGFPVLEAQACATPVLCANSSSLPEVAGEGALLVDAADAGAIREGIQQLSTDADLRQRLVAAGLENARRFSWQKTAGQALASLEQAASER